jgi:hypothetical protein
VRWKRKSRKPTERKETEIGQNENKDDKGSEEKGTKAVIFGILVKVTKGNWQEVQIRE